MSMQGAPIFSCLIGNGLSISYNPLLSVPSLTETLIQALESQGGSNATIALAQFARSLRADGSDVDPRERFETLLAPLESASAAFSHLRNLAPLTMSPGIESIRAAANLAKEFVEEVHTLGLGSILQFIAAFAFSQGEERFEESIVQVCRAISRLQGNSPISVATLNYDGLVHAGFLRARDSDLATFSDLAAGYSRGQRAPDGQHLLECYELRNSDDLEARVQLFNLHGSLAWLMEPESKRVWKFELRDLRSLGSSETSYWEIFRQGTAEMLPVVVLTDRKSQVIGEWPFSLAYEIFEQRCVASDHWLIAGYAFGDEPVNRVFARALESRLRLRLGTPKILVLDEAADESPIRRKAASVLGVDPDDLLVDATGLPGSIAGSAWQAWST